MTTDWRYISEIVRTDIDAGYEDFGMRDRFSRAIGCRWFLQHCVVGYLTDAEVAVCRAKGEWLWARDATALTDYFELRAQPTRNGERYGASTPSHECATEVEARAVLAEHLVKARKYNAKVNARTSVPA